MALACAAALVAPLAALAQAVTNDWSPHGDDATVALRTWDVWSGDPPLTGMRSTSGDTGHPELASHHPGPLAFYLLALPLALAGGGPLGIALGCVTIAAVASLLTVVWARRLGGEIGVLVLGGGLLLTQWAVGPEALYRPLNPYPALLPTYLALLLAWAAWRGDHRAYAPFAVATAILLQANLAFVPLGLALTALVVAACLRRHRRGTPEDPLARRDLRRAALVTLVVWLPSLVELLVNRPNNLTQVVRWATSGTGTSIGLGGAFEHLSLLAPAPGGFRRFSVEMLLQSSTGPAVIGMIVLLLLAVISTGLKVPNGRSSSVWPARVALVANLAMLATAAQLPEWPTAPYWVVTWLPVVAFSWAAIAWRAVAYVPNETVFLPLRTVLPCAAALLALACVLTALTNRPAVAEDQAMTRTARAVVAELGPGEGRALRVQGQGFTPVLAAAPAVAYEAHRAGWEPHFLTPWPNPSDADHLWAETTPEGAEHVIIVDSTEPEVQDLPERAREVGSVEMTHRDGRLTIYRVPGA